MEEVILGWKKVAPNYFDQRGAWAVYARATCFAVVTARNAFPSILFCTRTIQRLLVLALIPLCTTDRKQSRAQIHEVNNKQNILQFINIITFLLFRTILSSFCISLLQRYHQYISQLHYTFKMCMRKDCN